MLDISAILSDPKAIQENCARRGVAVDITALTMLHKKRSAAHTELDALRSRRKHGSKKKPTDDEIAHMKQLGEEIGALEEQGKSMDDEHMA